MMKTLIAGAALATALGLVAPLAIAAQPDASQDATLAPNSCKKPVIPSNNIRKADGTEDFNEKLNAYQDCIKGYVDAQNTLAKAHITAANAAVSDANEFVKEVNDKLNSKN